MLQEEKEGMEGGGGGQGRYEGAIGRGGGGMEERERDEE